MVTGNSNFDQKLKTLCWQEQSLDVILKMGDHSSWF